MSLPPEPERIRLKTPEKSFSNEKLSEKNARLRLSQEGLYDRNYKIHNERLCLSSERLNQGYGEKNDERKYQSIFINDQNRNNLIDVDIVSKEKSLSSSNFKNDQIKERSFRSQENLNCKSQQKNKNSPTFQEQKEKFLQEIKEKANGFSEKHLKNVKNDSEKFQKSPILKDVKDKRSTVLPRRNVNNFLAVKNIPENFSPGPQLVPERDLNSGPLRNCEVDFFVGSQFAPGSFSQKVDDLDLKHDEYFHTPTSRESSDSLREPNKDDVKVKQDQSQLRSGNETKCNRLDGKPDIINRSRGESHIENNYENVDVPRNAQNYENEVREKVLYPKKEQKLPEKCYNQVKKDSNPDLKADESVILIPSDFDNSNQKNLVVKPLTPNVRSPNANSSRHSTRSQPVKSHTGLKTVGGSSQDKSNSFGDLQVKQVEGSPVKDGSGKSGSSVTHNKSVPQANKQGKNLSGSKVVSSRPGNAVPGSNSSTRSQRLPHRHVSEQELRLIQVSYQVYCRPPYSNRKTFKNFLPFASVYLETTRCRKFERRNQIFRSCLDVGHSEQFTGPHRKTSTLVEIAIKFSTRG